MSVKPIYVHEYLTFKHCPVLCGRACEQICKWPPLCSKSDTLQVMSSNIASNMCGIVLLSFLTLQCKCQETCNIRVTGRLCCIVLISFIIW